MTVDLTTRYLGLELANPVVPSASTLSQRSDTLKRLQDAGAAAIVMQSLFEEQIEAEEIQIDRVLETGAESFAEARTYLPELDDYNVGPDAYLRHLEQTKRELEIPVIGSLNGSSEGGWTRYAHLIQEAGADALELNVYYVAADPDTTSAEVEQRYLDLVADVRSSVTIPLAVKVGPFFSSMANMARRLVEAGADGLVLFNRFLQPDIDLETLAVDPTLHLSTSEELRLPLRWIAILHGRVRGVARRHHGSAHGRGRREAHPRRRRRHDDGLGAVPAGAGTPPGRAGGRRTMARGARVFLGGGSPGEPQPGGLAGPGGVRAVELHAGGGQLHEPVRLAGGAHGAPSLTEPGSLAAGPSRG